LKSNKENMKKTFKIIGVVLVVLIIGGYFAVEFAIENNIRTNLDEYIEKNKQFGTLKYSDLSICLAKRELVVSGIELTPLGSLNPIILDSVTVDKFKKGSSGVPQELSFTAKGLHIDARQIGPQGRSLLELGYDFLLADIGLDFAYDQEKKELHLNDLSYGAESAGFVNMNFHLSELDLENFNLFSLMFAIPKVKLHSGGFKYADDSFFERSMKVAAVKQGKTPEQILVEAEATLDAELAKAKDEFSKKVLNTLKQFVRNPKQISISVLPPEKVSIQKIQETKDPKELVKLLNMKVEL